MDQRSIEKHLRRWHRRDKSAGDDLSREHSDEHLFCRTEAERHDRQRVVDRKPSQEGVGPRQGFRAAGVLMSHAGRQLKLHPTRFYQSRDILASEAPESGPSIV